MHYSGLIKSIWTLSLIGTILGCGIGIVPFGGLGALSDWNKLSMTAVLAAAPLRTRRMNPAKVQLTHRNAPPPYSNITFVNTHFSQFNPSSDWVPPVMENSLIMSRSGGTTGSTPEMTIPRGPEGGEEGAGCARVDVWLPKTNKDIMASPTIRDPDATVIIDITPPLSEPKGCTIWRHHDGEPPPKKPVHIPRDSTEKTL